MKKLLDHVKNQLLTGVIFVIPVFFIISIVQKIWTSLNSAGSIMAEKLGFKALLGSNSVTFATALLLIAIFYVFGWLVRFSMLKKFKNWLENGVLQYLPGYLPYKAKMEEKLLPKKDARKPVLVDYQQFKRPGLLIEIQEENAVVFFPNAPDSNNGQTHLVKAAQLEYLNTDASVLLKSLQACGKSLPIK